MDIPSRAEQFTLELAQASPTEAIYLVVGGKSSGKTQFLSHLCDGLKKRGISVGGILSPAEITDGLKDSYFVKSIASGESRQLCSSRIKGSSVRIGSYGFDTDAISFGNREILTVLKTSDHIIIDEAGPLELEGEGWRPALDELFGDKKIQEGKTIIISIRSTIKEQFINEFGISNFMEISLND